MIKGVIAPNITFFEKDGKIDKEKTRWHMNWMFENGVDGFFLTGSYGAGPLMSIDERKEIFIIAKEVAIKFKDKYLIAHVGCAETSSSINLAQAAESIGVDAIASVPPFYYKYESEVVVAYYKQLINSVHIPTYAYNNPKTTRFTFKPNTIYKLQELGLKGIKDSSMDVEFLSSIYYDKKFKNKDFDIILGTSTGWIPMFHMGINAMIAGMCNYFPELIVHMYNCTIQGKMTEAEKAYKVMLDLNEKIKFTDSTIVSHMALYARGYDGGYPRLPMILPNLDDEKYCKIGSAIKSVYDERIL